MTTVASIATDAPRTPLLVIAGVSATDRTAPKTFSLFRKAPPKQPGSLVDVRLDLGPGVVAVVGGAEDGALVLVDVLSGRVRPDRGKVLVGGREPSKSPDTRKAIGCLFAQAELLPAKTVRESLDASLAVAGALASGVTGASVLAAFGLDALADRDPRTLSSGDARGVELARALSTPSPRLVVLHEPFVDIGGVALEAVRERISAIGQTASVLLVTAAASDATLATTVLALHSGTIARGGPNAGKLGGFERTELHVWVTSGARALAKALTGEPALLGVSLEGEPNPASEGGVLRIAGPDVAAVALALADAVVATGALVTGIGRVSPTLGEIRATTESVRYARHAAAHAAYRDTYAAETKRLADYQAARASSQHALFAKPAAQAPPPASVAPRAWAPQSTPPPAQSAEDVAAQEAKWGPKSASLPPVAAPSSPPPKDDLPPPKDDLPPSKDDPRKAGT